MLRRRLSRERVLMQVILIGGSLVMAYPLIFGALASFATLEAYYRSIWLPIPIPFSPDNYLVIISTQSRALGWVFNTLIRIAWYILLPGLVAVLCGYVFARLRFKGRDAIFLLLLSSLMVPGIVYFVPTYVMLARWPLAGGNDLFGQGGFGFVNRWPALLLPGLVNAFYIFLLRQTYYTIPGDFEEAARIDGANTGQVLYHVYLPMLKPAITVMVIFQSVAIWNDYLWPLIAVGGNDEIWPLALGFQRIMFSGSAIKGQPGGATILDYPFAFALATLATLPMVLLFLVLQRYFVEGVQGFAIKG